MSIARSPTAKKMKYVPLGNSGLKISRIVMGCMSYGSKGWYPWVFDDEEEILRQIKFAYDHGIQTFDTANLYSNGLSEVLLGKAIKQHDLPREELVIMTKLFGPVAPEYSLNLFHPGGPTPEDYGIINQRGLTRKHIFDSVQASLKRMQLDYIDVLQCHRFDKTTPIEETMHALHDVVKAGYVRYIGMSSCWAYQLHQMQNYAITHGLTPFISMQNHYNLIYREEEREMFPTLKLFKMGAITWSPLAGGLLGRPLGVPGHRKGADESIKRYMGYASEDIINRTEEIAKKKGISMSQVSVAWLLSKSSVTAPIIGTTNMNNLEDILGALDVELTDEEIKYLEEPYLPRPINGHV